MVQIPTSRDLGRVGVRSGRISPSGPSVSVGAAVAGMGQAITQVAFDLNDLRTQEAADNLNKRSLDVSTALTRFADEEERAFLKAQEESSESGIGFTRSFMEGYQQRANAFAKANLEGLSPEQSTGYLNQLLGRANSLYEKSYSFETQAKSNFYDRTTNTNLDTVRGQITNNAAPFEELRAQGLAAIESADMPEAWKAERRQAWDADAAESKWQWEYRQDPEAAVAAISMAPIPDNVAGVIAEAANRYGQDADTLQKIAMLESRGNPGAKNPSSSAGGLFQFVDGTAGDYGLADRYDAAQASDAAARLLRDNRNRLLKNLGREPTPGELYLAHQQGAGGAINLLRDPSQRAVDVLGREQVRLNLPSSMRGRADSITAGEFASLWTKKMGDADSAGLYANIPTDRRMALASQGQTQIDQQVTAQRTAEKDRINLIIADDPFQIDRATIMDNGILNDGDKASLLNSWNTATKDRAEARDFINAMSAGGGVSVNPFDADQRALADKAFDEMVRGVEDPSAVTAGFVQQTGYVPKRVQSELRRGAASTDPALMQQAMQAADVVQRSAPMSFGNFEGSSAVQKNLDLYRAYTEKMDYSPEEASRKIIEANDPERIRQRDILMKSEPVKKAIDDIDAGDIAASFDDSALGWRRNPDVGETPAAQAVIVAEYRSIYQEAIADANGDLDAARSMADQRFRRIYGVSDLSQAGRGVVVKYPPENAYPPNIDGSHAYIREQLVEALTAEGVTPDKVYLQADENTAKDIRAGRPARYQIFYEQNGQLERYYLPFYADPDEARRRTLQQSEERMMQNRDQQEQMSNRDQQALDAGDAAMSETVGPDWMQARSREMATERARQEPTQLDRITVEADRGTVDAQKQQRNQAIQQERRDIGSMLRGGWVNE